MVGKFGCKIMIVIHCVGYIKHIYAKDEIEIVLDKGLKLSQLRDEVDILKSISASYIVNGKAVDNEYVLKNGDVITLVPHISGG